MTSLKQEIISIACEMGVDEVGFADKERLEDAPPSGDLEYILPSAKSAISLAVSLNKDAIQAYLAKKDRTGYVEDYKRSYRKLKAAGLAIQKLLNSRGYDTLYPYVNFDYRQDQPFAGMKPPLSHRYVAVASGIGWLGWSGNVITPEYGATVSLSSVVTSAELEPDPLVEGDFCKNCRLCVASCPGRFISMKDETTVYIAGRTFIHNKKPTNLRCFVSCGGANGARSPDAEWSTWSYKVLNLPELGDDLEFEQTVRDLSRVPEHRLLRILLDDEKLKMRDWDHFDQTLDVVLITCSNCMLICWPDMKDRKENYRLLTSSGKVVKCETGLKIVHV